MLLYCLGRAPKAFKKLRVKYVHLAGEATNKLQPDRRFELLKAARRSFGALPLNICLPQTTGLRISKHPKHGPKPLMRGKAGKETDRATPAFCFLLLTLRCRPRE